MTNIKKNKFLTAEWRNLILANYPVDPEVLLPYLPKGTELDFYNDICYVSLVGFMFLNTKVLGVSVPFHKNFEELNLRFYVKRKTPDGWRRGVVFVKEIVPRFAIAYTARTLYREPYTAMPMKHEFIPSDNTIHVAYYFQHENFWNKMSVVAETPSFPIAPGSEEEFITEHYWGYNRYSENSTMEYEVEHPSWKIHKVLDSNFHIRYQQLYGANFAPVLQTKPLSIFLAEGSEICVRKGEKIIF